MIPIYQIHQMLEPLQGGTTRPWTALVDDGGGLPEVYVVKLFSARQLEQAGHIAGEVMGSVLCGEFDIDTRPSEGARQAQRPHPHLR